MNEQLQAIGKKLAAYADYIAIAVFLGILTASYYLYSQESNAPAPPRDPQTEVRFNEHFTDPEKAKDLAKVEENFLGKPLVFEEDVPAEADISQDAEKRRLVQISMFDPQTVEDAERVELAVREDFNEAQDFASRDEYDQAIEKLNNILQRYPTHQRSRRLLDEMVEAKAQAEAGAETEGEGAIN